MSQIDLSASDLESLSKQELISRINKLEANVRQLRSIIKKRQLDPDSSEKSGKVHKSREFDFTRYSKRHIALKFLYLGWDYQGYVVQEDTNNTIEDHVFQALLRTKLIEDRSSSNYHRCGRTDKGVSAFSQVISIDVRSKLKSGLGVSSLDEKCVDDSEIKDDEPQEIDYCGILNKVLPDEIRCLSWAPVRADFSARFDCKGRCYYYYFPASNLKIDKMKEAAQYLLGTHDFTNFCKKDTSRKEINNIRTIQKVDIFSFNQVKETADSSYSIYIAQIAASGFLWHQIRCIMTILFLVGEGKEDPDIVKKLLDVNNVTSKPQYMLASELPLVLFNTDWNPDDIGEWHYSSTLILDLIKHLQGLWTRQMIKCSMIRSMIEDIKHSLDIEVNCQHNILNSETCTKSHKPILERPRCGGENSQD
ncbi:tRNA pseudouridine(38/39) synthase [Tetranychus urticae]|uniref:tRNA pseudouridine(38/39) synthase n=1 Tax=Tetranychus urticae TaxID=32264 RepID=UPI00077BEF10|nr:tRNA pseudouridine(38/39) synthase [Tetranychus urticae]XP_015792084.1 tRNA pseudouridine(38/39) synthase [Tetranychus urticae]